jgi:alpha-mannosidase
MRMKINSKRAARLYILLFVALIMAAPLSLQVFAASYFNGGTIHLVQTSHSDIGWADGPVTEIAQDNGIIDSAMTLFGQSSGFKYVSEDMLHYKQFIDNRTQAQVDAVKAKVNNGTFEFGAAYSSPYEELLSSEQMARQLYFGRKWFKEVFPGQDTKVYYAVDPPERALQMSQLLQKAGVPYEFTSRYYGRVPGVPNDSLAKWSSPDGSSTLVFAYSHYGRLGYSGEVDMSSTTSIKNYVDSWDAYYSSHNLPKQVIMLWETDDRTAVNYDTQIANWNTWASANGYPTMKYSTMKEAMDTIAAGNLASVDTTAGGRPNLWLYEAAPTNHWAISYQREGGVLAAAAEAFWTFRSMLEGNYNNYPQTTLKQIWQDLVWACHGWARQDTVDAFTNTYKNARDSAQTQLTAALTWIAKKVNTQVIGTPLVIYNALSWQRTDVVTADVPAGAPSPFTLKDAAGSTITYQLLPANKMIFVATALPSMGYKTYYLVSGGTTPGDGPAKNTTWNTLYENTYYRVTPVSGGVSSIYDKETAKELLDTTKFKGAEILLMDSGSGMGAGEFQTFPYVLNSILDRSTTHGLTWTCTEDGPVRRAYETTYTFTNFSYKLKAIIYSGIKRIDFEPSITSWNGTNHREVRMMFPLATTTRDIAFDVPFAISKVGVSEVDPAYFGFGAGHQPRETQTFMYGGGTGFGVTLGSSVAPIDYMDPTVSSSNQTIIQPILLATRDSCAGSYYWSQTGSHDYKFSIYSHAQGYQYGYKSGIQFNNPLIGTAPGTKDADASLAESGSFASVSQANVIISAIKRADNDGNVVARLFEIEGTDSTPTFQFMNTLQSAKKASLIEDDGAALTVNGSSVSLPVGHNAIETMKLNLGMTIPTPPPSPTPTPTPTPLPTPDPSKNLALNKTATASSEYSGSYSAAKAVDGIAAGLENTKWNTASGQSEPHWLKVDLGQSSSITRYIVKHAGYNNIEPSGYNTRDFKFQTSADGNTWTDVDTITANAAGMTDRFVTASDRYVRLYITDAGVTDAYARIYEFEVYGTGGATSTPTPTPTPAATSTPTPTPTPTPTGAPTATPAPPDKGWWKFDETSGATAADSSGNGNTGTVSGASWTTGHLSNALSFNGSSNYVLAGNYPKPTTTATYTAWVYANSAPTWASIIKNWGNTTAGQIHLGIDNTSGKLSVYMTQSNGTTVNCIEATAFPTGSWQHVATVADGSTIRLYRNGTQVASVSYNGTLKTSFNALGIGVKPNEAGTGPDSTNPGYWNGKIDDVRIYNRALSAQEITTLASQ